jgi:hypothetical protein
MRTISPTLQAHLAARQGFVIRLLFYAWPKNRSTGAVEEVGLWTGATHQDFTIGGDLRSYAGAGGVMAIAPVISAIGLDIRHQRVTLSAIFPEVEDLMRGYDPHRAPAELHRALYDPASRALIEEPHRLFKGFITKAKITRPEAGAMATVDLTLASTARNLTQPLAVRQSDASQRLRAGDRFFKHADVSGEVDVIWGEAG